MCICVCAYKSIYISIICKHVCMYVLICETVCKKCVFVCMYACMHACMSGFLYAYVCMHACRDVKGVYVYMYVDVTVYAYLIRHATFLLRVSASKNVVSFIMLSDFVDRCMVKVMPGTGTSSRYVCRITRKGSSSTRVHTVTT